MRIMAVDPRPKELKKLVKWLRQLYPDGEEISFQNPMLAAKYSFNNSPDILYVASDMRGIDGRELIKFLMVDNPQLRACLILPQKETALELKQNGFIYYLVEPVTLDKLRAVEERWATQ